MVTVGTCLTVDDQTAVRVVVEEYSVKFECPDIDIEMDAASLREFITRAEKALPTLSARAQARRAELPVSDRPSSGEAVTSGVGTSASTWVVCDATDRIKHMTVGEQFELNWGGLLVWTISAGALARLLDRARRARPVLDAHLNALRRMPDDVEIPDLDEIGVNLAVTERVRPGGKARAGADK